MSCTLEVDQVLKTAEAIYLQIKECKNLPGPIQEILGFGTHNDDESSARLSPASGSSSPDHTPLHATRVVNGSGPVVNGGSEPGTAVTTPDDNSIEILHPDNMEMGL